MSYAVEEERSNPSPKKKRLIFFTSKHLCGHPEQCSFSFKYLLYFEQDSTRWFEMVKSCPPVSLSHALYYVGWEGREALECTYIRR